MTSWNPPTQVNVTFSPVLMVTAAGVNVLSALRFTDALAADDGAAIIMAPPITASPVAILSILFLVLSWFFIMILFL